MDQLQQLSESFLKLLQEGPTSHDWKKLRIFNIRPTVSDLYSILPIEDIPTYLSPASQGIITNQFRTKAEGKLTNHTNKNQWILFTLDCWQRTFYHHIWKPRTILINSKRVSNQLQRNYRIKRLNQRNLIRIPTRLLPNSNTIRFPTALWDQLSKRAPSKSPTKTKPAPKRLRTNQTALIQNHSISRLRIPRDTWDAELNKRKTTDTTPTTTKRTRLTETQKQHIPEDTNDPNRIIYTENPA
jgi:hypothetical protein